MTCSTSHRQKGVSLLLLVAGAVLALVFHCTSFFVVGLLYCFVCLFVVVLLSFFRLFVLFCCCFIAYCVKIVNHFELLFHPKKTHPHPPFFLSSLSFVVLFCGKL